MKTFGLILDAILDLVPIALIIGLYWVAYKQYCLNHA